MSLEQNSPCSNPLPPPLPLAQVSGETSVCKVCRDPMNEGQECLIIGECGHAFHGLCIENHLSTTSECPVCKRSCQLSELRKLVIPQQTGAITKLTRGRPRGAIAKHYNTRSTSRNLFQEPLNAISNVAGNYIDTSEQEPSRPNLNNPNAFENQIVQTPVRGGGVSPVDYQEINKLIEQNISKILQNLNLMPTPNENRNSRRDIRPTISTQNLHSSQQFERNRRPAATTPNVGQNIYSPLNSNSFLDSNFRTLNADRITSIIRNWNLEFDGSLTGLNVEEFLYRLRVLTKDNFNNDFSMVCRNLHILLSGKARDWYWRYHKKVENIEWSAFCDALRYQYREFKSCFDIREEIRNRKQKPGECFDSFFESVSAIMDKLPTPMSELELIEILARNLRPEIRQELLYVPIHSISHLRKLIQMRENFLSEEHVRKNFISRSLNQYVPRRIAGITDSNKEDCSEPAENFVEAIQKSEIISKCWNCEEVGHHWENCLRERTIFCYGCGAKQVYKPNCSKCAEKGQNSMKNFRPVTFQRDKM